MPAPSFASTAAPALGAGGSSLSSGALRAVAGRFGAALYHSPLVESSTRTRRLRPPRRSLRHEGRRCRDGRGSQPPGPPGRQRKSWRCTVLVHLEAAGKERAAGTIDDFIHGRQGALWMTSSMDAIQEGGPLAL